MGLAPAIFYPGAFRGLPFGFHAGLASPPDFSTEYRLHPSYPAKSPLEEVLKRVPPGSDEYITEKYAAEIGQALEGWAAALQSGNFSELGRLLDPAIEATSPLSPAETVLRKGRGLRSARREFAAKTLSGQEPFLREFRDYLGPNAAIKTAEFQVIGVDQLASSPLTLKLDIRYGLVLAHTDGRHEERVGNWTTEWVRDPSNQWTARKWQWSSESAAVAQSPVFTDITHQALGGIASYHEQLLRGADHWRSVLDGACGIDVYGNNGIAAGDFDNDGFDDLYICQPAGLPNRLYRNRGDGTFEDVTEKAGVGVLDNTACALFADLRSSGLQDLLVVCGSGPLLFLNQGNGAFALKRDAFRFARPPQGTFTHAAIADYDRDGRLDIYFCLYNYYLGLDQYHYPVPYYDARNGPPNFLLRNEGDALFTDVTEAAGLNANNNRYSFACAWGGSGASGLPDLYVANDFGRGNLYRNNGNGTFTDISTDARVEDPGAGMSAAWSDYDNDGRNDIYAANMWSAAGQRVAAQKLFHANAPESTRAFYRRHARGNSLYRNLGNGSFENVSDKAGVEMGRWSWCSDFWDFDHDGCPDLYIANGYISSPDRTDLSSFFWRQVVGKSPDDTTPSAAYEHGWNALNELIRSDSSWSGYERNVLCLNNGNGTFSEISGAAGMDFPEDSRSFALADIDHDGRLEVILKNRNAPQIRILRNTMQEIGHSIAFRLRGHKSNRDAIGASITVEAGPLRQTKFLQAGSGFLAQHTKELHFGLGSYDGPVRATVRWPGGEAQEFTALPVNQRIEIEEGSAQFKPTPFAASLHPEPQSAPPASSEELPAQIETWLLDPLKAPDFSLPDLAGKTHSLAEFQGAPMLLTFWATKAPGSRKQLETLNHQKIPILAIHVDDPADLATARAFAAQLGLTYPVVFATPETAGIYNIIYRYLYDRRRDLPIPCSFLLDREGTVVKLYQGEVNPRRVLEDMHAIPATAAERMQKALPFTGQLYQDAFQRNDFTYGVALFQHGYLDAATASFEQVIARKPDDPEALYNLGTLYLRRNNLDQADQYLRKTVQLRPDYPEAWNNLGMIAAQQGRTDEAIGNFQRSLSERPTYTITLLNLGNLYRRQGAFDKAQPLLSRALELEPDDPEANYSLGMLSAQQGQFQQARDFLEKAIALRPDYPEARNNLGVLFVRNKDFAEAEDQFQTAIRLSPGFDQSYINLARIYAMQGRRDKAGQVLQDLLRLQPGNRNAQQALEMLKSLP